MDSTDVCKKEEWDIVDHQAEKENYEEYTQTH